MMKKKVKNYVDVRHNNIDKPTENKENRADLDKYNEEKSENSGSNGSEEYASDELNSGATASDKVVLDVKFVEEKLAEIQDKYLRLSAEFDNYRKRTLREKIELSKYAGENLLLGIIPLMDDFERALKHMDSTTNCVALKDGIDIIYGKFSDFLKQNGIKEIESLDSNFNVDLHDAVAKVPVVEADKKGKVVEVVLKGYYLHDKVLRHSKVVVGE
ncbi:MAG: nucleotide exchange factor GrpE [Bacteroidales bacterium]|jgi:molecular chaperone GrpE